ncbi:hypothetical protein MishRS11D_07310 [Methylomagnum ishizawai]|nr:hypothetical protein MishRS11D_07310 [Methylomagnum ishizawai]
MKTNQTPLLHSREKFLEWYLVSTLGQILQTIEASYLQSALKLTYNQKTLQVGLLGSETLYIDPEFLRDFVLVDDIPPASSLRPHSLIAAATELPIDSESVDVLILPHVIEFEADRHQVLREAERVLKPEGRLFILGINPWNPHGLIGHLPREPAVWHTRSVSSHRMLDWLGLMKFEAEYNAAFSISTSQVLGRPDSLWDRTKAELSFAYAIKAIKRRYTLIPLKPQWINAPSLAAGHMFEQPKILTLDE